MMGLILIILVIIAIVHGWVKILMHEWTEFENNIALYMVMVFHISRQEALSLVRGLSYCVYGGLMASIIIYFSKFSLTFNVNVETVILAVLGAFAELSIVRLFTMICATFFPEINLVDEIQRVRWIRGAFKLSPKFVFVCIVSAAVIEELFFRGSVMYLLLKTTTSGVLTLSLMTFLFVYEQILLTETYTQKIIIGFASIVISMVGGLLVLTTNTIWPAMFAHASFVIFYVRRW